jgi:hypothetical protein
LHVVDLNSIYSIGEEMVLIENGLHIFPLVGSSHVEKVASDNKIDLVEWITTINQVISSNK